MKQNKIRLIGLPEVLGMTSLSKTSVYVISDFPKPIKIGGSDATAQGGSRWVEVEVIEWMNSRIKMRDAAQRGV